MSKEQGNTAPEIMPLPQSNEIHPRGLLEAISYIDQNFANELGGCMIKSRFLTTKQRLEFMEVGFRSSFASGIVSALLTPIAIGVIEQYIPMFGDTSPTLFDTYSAFLLALSFSLGYAIFMAKASTCFIGEYTRAMVLNLLGGMIFGAIVFPTTSGFLSSRRPSPPSPWGCCRFWPCLFPPRSSARRWGSSPASSSGSPPGG